MLSSQKLKLKKKGEQTEIVITIFPPLEFWLVNPSPYKLSMYNTTVDILFTGGITTTKLHPEDSIVIEEFESVSSQYWEKLSNSIKQKTGA